MMDLTGISNVHPSKILNMINSFYCSEASDADIELYDGSDRICSDIQSAKKISMNTGLSTQSGDSIWVHGVLNSPGSRGKYGVFRAQWMSVRYSEIDNGHRLLQEYPELNGFVYLYPKYLARNLIENANADIGFPNSTSYLIHRLNDAYRHASDKDIRITCHGAPCSLEKADEIVIPTGFFDTSGNPVYMHCEPADSGKDHPWCLHYFRVSELAKDHNSIQEELCEHINHISNEGISETMNVTQCKPNIKGLLAGFIKALLHRK